MKATTRTVKADGEFKVKLFIDGVYQVNCDYFTDDQEDARQTAEQMTLHAGKNDTPLVILKDVRGQKSLDYTLYSFDGESGNIEVTDADGDLVASIGVWFENGNLIDYDGVSQLNSWAAVAIMRLTNQFVPCDMYELTAGEEKAQQRNILLSNGFEQCEIDECFEDYNY